MGGSGFHPLVVVSSSSCPSADLMKIILWQEMSGVLVGWNWRKQELVVVAVILYHDGSSCFLMPQLIHVFVAVLISLCKAGKF
jgi:hypothetical protein